MNYIEYRFSDIRKAMHDAIRKLTRGYNDYDPATGRNRDEDLKNNMTLRASEGSLLGAGAGALAGTLIGHAKRKKAMQEAEREIREGTLNKILNAVDKDRIKKAGKEARKSVSVLRHAIRGGGLGTLAGVSAGALETLIKHQKRIPRIVIRKV